MQSTASKHARLVVVSNRLPVVVNTNDDGSFQVEPGAGGLVTALAPVLKDRGGLWIGWPGTGNPAAIDYLATTRPDGVGYDLKPVALNDKQVREYYQGFSNEVLWPLFHDLLSHCQFEPSYWKTYCEVNRLFAEAIVDATDVEDFVWVQDYHLMLVPKYLQELNKQRQLGFFLHIPFPPLDIFIKLPWRFQILEAMLSYQLLGFQTARDKRNFVNCVRTMLPGTAHSSRGNMSQLTWRDHSVHVGAFPIGIDYKKFVSEARSHAVAERAWYIHEAMPNRQLILGIDRLDYTKGLPERLLAYGNALERYPELRQKTNLIQVVVPSRVDVDEYQSQLQEIERLVGHINGRFTLSGWTPVHFIYRALEWFELLSYYRTCEIALVTPLKDGMNLIAKEYCACSVDTGVLILSEFAGAAAQLQHGALMTNPHDIEGMADAIAQAFHMPHDERRRRMRKLQRNVQRQDVFWWVDRYLESAIGKQLGDFAPSEFYVPQLPEEATAAGFTFETDSTSN